jgi:hypothetical protein
MFWCSNPIPDRGGLALGSLALRFGVPRAVIAEPLQTLARSDLAGGDGAD